MGSICSTTTECETVIKTQSLYLNKQTDDKIIQTSFSIQLADETINQEIENITTQVEYWKTLHKKSMLHGCIKYMQKITKNDLLQFWDRWKYTNIGSNIVLSEDIDIINEFNDSQDILLDQTNLDEAKSMIDFSNLVILNENPLRSFVKQTKNNEPAMPFANLFKFFEDMLDKKYESDVASLQANRQPSSIPDYFIDHLGRIYGLKKLAQKAMSQILVCLEELNRQNHNYGKVICRLLQIHDPQPIPTPLGLFLTKVRHDINKIISSKKQGSKIKGLEEIHIIDAISLIYTLFDTDKFSKYKAILLIKPKFITDEEYLAFRICNKIIRMGQTTENIFSMIDVNNRGVLGKSYLIENMKKILELHTSDQDLVMLGKILDPKDNNSVSRELFLNKISLKLYLDQTKNEKLTVSKSHFLNILIEVYKLIKVSDTAVLTSMFKAYNKIKINPSEFSQLILKLDNKMLQDQINYLYEESILQNSDSSLDGVILESFIKIVFKHAIGGKGLRDFSKLYTGLKVEDNENLDEKPTPIKIPETEADAELCRSPGISFGKRQSSDTIKKAPRRPSYNNVDRGKVSRGSTPTNLVRSKSPAFGFRNS
jgi:hypothetical protein